MTKIEPAVLRAALIGYQQQLDFVNSQINRLRGLLNGVSDVPVLGAAAPSQKHHVSPEGRARIAAAQRKRWAATRRAAKSAR